MSWQTSGAGCATLLSIPLLVASMAGQAGGPFLGWEQIKIMM